MNFFVVIVLLVCGWFLGEYVQDQIVEKCTKGETFVVKHHEFRCVRADLKGAVDAAKGALKLKNPEDE
jgi:hypothetical protein